MESVGARLREVALLFLRLGFTAFGGPAAHITMMRHEVVERRQWLTSDEFLDLLGATNFIPGPNSTEMAIHVGQLRAGWRGLIVAGACFILPAAALTMALAWAYVQFGQLPVTSAMLYGVKPVIVAIIIQAVWVLGRAALKSRLLAALALGAAVLNAFGGNELVVLFGAGALSMLLQGLPSPAKPKPNGMLIGAPVAAGAAASGVSSAGILLVFLKIGSVLFGSGYVLLAFLRAELVQGRHWLTEGQLLDAVAAGQVTPGPVFCTATFIGYLLTGWQGAVAATVGIFLPAFVFVALSGPLIPRLRRSPWAAPFLDGLNVASLALMAVVSLDLGRAALLDRWTVAFFAVSSVLLLRFKVGSMWLVLGGALLGSAVRGFT